MEKRITISNKYLKVELSTIGAELKSIIDSDGTQRLWQGNPDFWKDQSPILFPICGRLTEGTYLYNEKPYKMGMHGFASKCEFSVENCHSDSVVFLLKSNEETKLVYPFDFELRAKYTLENNSIIVTYTVNNNSDSDMYFSIGSHEGYICEGDISDYNLIFDKKEELENHLLNGPLLNGKTEPAPIKNGIMELIDSEFERLDTYIFKNTVSKSVTLKKKGAKKSITVDFPETPHLLIWKAPGGELVCIEPWCGLPDNDGDLREISKKDSIITLQKDAVFTNTHKITVNG